jgi:hypothetical protein
MPVRKTVLFQTVFKNNNFFPISSMLYSIFPFEFYRNSKKYENEDAVAHVCSAIWSRICRQLSVNSGHQITQFTLVPLSFLLSLCIDSNAIT